VKAKEENEAYTFMFSQDFVTRRIEPIKIDSKRDVTKALMKWVPIRVWKCLSDRSVPNARSKARIG
jgi:hypothetical protein